MRNSTFVLAFAILSAASPVMAVQSIEQTMGEQVDNTIASMKREVARIKKESLETKLGEMGFARVSESCGGYYRRVVGKSCEIGESGRVRMNNPSCLIVDVVMGDGSAPTLTYILPQASSKRKVSSLDDLQKVDHSLAGFKEFMGDSKTQPRRLDGAPSCGDE